MTSAHVIALERRALELVKQGDFGPEAIQVNAAIAEQAPRNESAWTRLGRCHLEQRDWDAAVSALRSVLAVNPSNGIATNLLNEVRRRRAMTPTATQRATTGFSAREFALLEMSPADEASTALRSRVEALFDAINASSTATRIVEARQKNGESGSKLFHSNSFHSISTGVIVAFHHGGRWEPQFNIGSCGPGDARPSRRRNVSGAASNLARHIRRVRAGRPDVVMPKSEELLFRSAFSAFSAVKCPDLPCCRTPV